MVERLFAKMQNPNEDTEWNDVLRKKGIIPEKEKSAEPEITEEELIKMMDKTIKEKSGQKDLEDMNLDELDELEDEEDEAILAAYRNQRLAEMKAHLEASKYGVVKEISAPDYVKEVNEAGNGVFVVLHLYKQGIMLCNVINNFFGQLAAKFPTVKFLKSISTTCIPNYPDQNLPTIFVYYEGKMKSQLVGPMAFRGTSMKLEELEFILGRTGAIDTDVKSDPRPKVKDVMMSKLGHNQDDSDSD